MFVDEHRSRGHVGEPPSLLDKRRLRKQVHYGGALLLFLCRLPLALVPPPPHGADDGEWQPALGASLTVAGGDSEGRRRAVGVVGRRQIRLPWSEHSPLVAGTKAPSTTETHRGPYNVSRIPAAFRSS